MQKQWYQEAFVVIGTAAHQSCACHWLEDAVVNSHRPCTNFVSCCQYKSSMLWHSGHHRDDGTDSCSHPRLDASLSHVAHDQKASLTDMGVCECLRHSLSSRPAPQCDHVYHMRSFTTVWPCYHCVAMLPPYDHHVTTVWPCYHCVAMLPPYDHHTTTV